MCYLCKEGDYYVKGYLISKMNLWNLGWFWLRDFMIYLYVCLDNFLFFGFDFGGFYCFKGVVGICVL